MIGDISVIVEEVRLAGFRFAPAEQFRALLTPTALAEWPSFAASWEDLDVDTYTWPTAAVITADASRPSPFPPKALSARRTSRIIRAGTTTYSMGESSVGSNR
jgi:hypothetical protein